jgi:K+-transporting ATPase ATPase A chain
MIMFVVLTVFLAGLMVGRTPEYLGKKIEWRDVQWVVIAVLMPGALILIGSGISSILPVALASRGNQGPHGLSEILYAFSSGSANNGSAFAGLNANTIYYNVVLGIIMLIARCAIIIPSIGLAGQLARKNSVPESIGTFSTNTVLFAILLLFSIIIVSALTYTPAQILGPIIEQFLMLRGYTF